MSERRPNSLIHLSEIAGPPSETFNLNVGGDSVLINGELILGLSRDVSGRKHLWVTGDDMWALTARQLGNGKVWPYARGIKSHPIKLSSAVDGSTVYAGCNKNGKEQYAYIITIGNRSAVDAVITVFAPEGSVIVQPLILDTALGYSQAVKDYLRDLRTPR